MRVHITKHQARNWLNNTTGQRPINARNVARLQHDMDNGHWKPDVSAIMLDKNSNVIDGQHRLLAFLDSTLATLEIDVKTDVDPELQMYVDVGKTRSLADTLVLVDGVTKEEARAASAIYWQSRKWSEKHQSNQWPRHAEVEWIRAHSHMHDAIAATLGMKTNTGMMRVPMGTAGTLWTIAKYGEGAEFVEEFIPALQEGQLNGLPLASKLLRIDQERRLRKQRGVNMNYTISLMTARVYLAWLNNESIEKLFARRSVLSELPGYYTWLDKLFNEDMTP